MFEYEYNGCGRPKKYFEEELLGLVIYGGYNNKNSCRELSDWCLNNDELLIKKKESGSTVSSVK